MNTKLEDFIYSCSEFNDCTFCKEFGFSKNCPLKNVYKPDVEPTSAEVEKNLNTCKKYVISSLIQILQQK